MLLTAADLPPILVGAGEHPGVHRAAADLATDLERILGRRPVVGSWDGTATRGLIVATDPELGGWQASSVRVKGDGVRFTGSDRCGTMWAVYRACEDLLGVDPLWLWTDHPPEQRDHVRPHDLPIEAPVVRHRGWFLNDEDLISEWLPGGGERRIDYPYYRQVTAPQALDRVLEAALRLRLDTIIPASFVDLANPAEAALVEAAVARGLFVTQHHIEPMGVSHFTLEKWATARGETVPSYVSQPERLRACWREYAERWARFGEQVLWTIGLRGRGDRAVWENDPQVDASPAGRGRLISAAMADQSAIVREVTGRADATRLTVMWAEMAGLNAGGHLAIPAGTIRVLCDHGSTQVWCNDFASTPRHDDTGIYIHAAYWGCGPHLVQGVRPARSAAMIAAALTRGDTALALLNIANLRETSLAAWHCAEAWWRGRAADEDDALARWCAWRLGDAGAAELYRGLFDAYADQGSRHGAAALAAALDITAPDPRLVEQHGAPLLDGATRGKGHEALGAIEALLDGRPPGRIHWLPAAEGAAWIASLTAPAAERFTTVARQIEHQLPRLPAGRQTFAHAHLLIQARTMAAISAWTAAACGAVCDLLHGDRPACAAALARGAEHLAAVMPERDTVATGIWEGWWRGDRKMDLPGMLSRSRRLLTRIQDQP